MDITPARNQGGHGTGKDAPAERASNSVHMSDSPIMRLLALIIVLAISGAIVLYREELAGLAAYGYPGLFLVSLLGNATIILPAPSLALVFATGSTFFPPLVGLAAGTGEAFGELTGYLAGLSGRGVIENQARYAQIRRWMDRYGLWVIFGLSALPNPFFDLAGLAAGALKVPLWQFLGACWAGKVVKTTWVAYAGAHAIPFVERLLST